MVAGHMNEEIQSLKENQTHFQKKERHWYCKTSGLDCQKKEDIDIKIVVNIEHKLSWRVTKTYFEEFFFTNSEDDIY